MKKTQILKTLVGSRANGLYDKYSDWDYRGVHIIPTEEILLSQAYRRNIKGTDWIEGNEDNISYELGHFLKLAKECNPSILEVFFAPIIDSYKYNEITTYISSWDYRETTSGEVIVKKENLGQELRDLFPYIWTPQRAFDAFIGYSYNQKKKMEQGEDNRREKFAIAYLRTLWNLCDLFINGKFTLEIKNKKFKKHLLEIKEGNSKWSNGKIIDYANSMINIAKELKDQCCQVPDYTKVDKFILKVRKMF